MQHRVGDRAAVEPLFERVRAVRAEYRIPFWTAIMLLVGDESPDIRRAVLESALFHQSTAEAGRAMQVVLDGDIRNRLDGFLSDVRPGNFLALQSGVEVDSSETAHIPMLDFRWEPSEANLVLTVETVLALGMGGWIFDSGRSFHFYGDRLLPSARALSAFLGRALLLMPVVDQRWVAHQLIEGGCALRISSGNSSQITPVLRTRVTEPSGVLPTSVPRRPPHNSLQA